MLGEINSTQVDRVVVADMEAGLGALTRMDKNHVDYVLVMVEPTEKSMDVGKRAVALIREGKIGKRIVVANKITDESQVKLIRNNLSVRGIRVIPEDRIIEDADRKGVAPIDFAPQASAVKALEKLVEHMLSRSDTRVDVTAKSRK